MKLIDNAKKVHKMWSVRLAIAAALLGAVEGVLPFWSDVLPAGVFAALSSIVAVGAAAARVIKQEALIDDE